MSRIDDMIEELCPDGVEFRPLGELVRIRNGKDHKHLDEGSVPVFGSGGVMRYASSAVAEGPSVLIPRKGSLGNIFFVDEPFWVVDTIFWTEIDQSLLEPKFLYHLLLAMRLEEMNQAGGVPSQTQRALNALRIPVPPPEVQREIVKTLDLFSQLEAELEAELEARRQQYEHYVEALLSPADEDRSVSLGELGEFVRGSGLQKKELRATGNPAIHYGELHTHYGAWATETKSFVEASSASRWRRARPGDLVIATTSEDDEAVAKATAWLGEQEAAVSGDALIYRHTLDPKWASYSFRSNHFHAQKRRHITGAKVRRISGQSLAKLRVAPPPLEEQRRIAAILDKFDALVNDISIGLPAELEARRKQYEYYRDKLLTFKEIGT